MVVVVGVGGGGRSKWWLARVGKIIKMYKFYSYRYKRICEGIYVIYIKRK